jgi:homogentisate 1,2-dioxygenase
MHQYSQGRYTTQGHKGIPEGHFEEEQGRRGFFGQVSHLIKPQPSTRWIDIQGPLRPHMYDLVKLEKLNQWQRIVFNNDVGIYKLKLNANANSDLKSFRNADGETLYFCHEGYGKVLTEYGLLTFKKGSYILIPKCVGHTLLCESACDFLVIESFHSAYREPDRGMVGKNAFYDPACFGKPDLEALQYELQKMSQKITEIEVKRAGSITKFIYSESVYDAVGWKGDFFPMTLHIDDMMPLNSHRVHLPPSAHTTFVTQGFVVCTFLPRPLETDADALKVPFYHQNIDYDEVLFYHAGDFFSRDNLHAGMMSFHPAGFPHGPHPKAVKNVSKKTHTDEVAVMVDTWNPLQVDPFAESVELRDYWKSWMTQSR